MKKITFLTSFLAFTFFVLLIFDPEISFSNRARVTGFIASESRLISDTDNIFYYPAMITGYDNFGVAEIGEMYSEYWWRSLVGESSVQPKINNKSLGAVLSIWKESIGSFGFFIDRNTTSDSLEYFIKQGDKGSMKMQFSDVFMPPRNVIQTVWGRKLLENLDIGAILDYGYTSSGDFTQFKKVPFDTLYLDEITQSDASRSQMGMQTGISLGIYDRSTLYLNGGIELSTIDRKSDEQKYNHIWIDFYDEPMTGGGTGEINRILEEKLSNSQSPVFDERFEFQLDSSIKLIQFIHFSETSLNSDIMKSQSFYKENNTFPQGEPGGNYSLKNKLFQKRFIYDKNLTFGIGTNIQYKNTATLAMGMVFEDKEIEETVRDARNDKILSRNYIHWSGLPVFYGGLEINPHKYFYLRASGRQSLQEIKAEYLEDFEASAPYNFYKRTFKDLDHPFEFFVGGGINYKRLNIDMIFNTTYLFTMGFISGSGDAPLIMISSTYNL